MQLVDLTHTISEDMQVYPGTEPPVLKKASTIEKEGFKETLIKFYSHTGTHMDSPAHILPNKKSLDKFSIECFYGRGFLVDCTDIESGGEITVEHISSLGEDIEKYDYILFYTGWQKKWGFEEYFYDFPTISQNLAKKLSKANIKGIGVDTISIDPITSSKLEKHHIVLSSEKVIIENLNNLDKLLGKEFSIYAFPLKYKDADGSPIRAVAMISDR